MEKFRIVSSPESVDLFLEVAALDRIAWLNSSDGKFVPDGEHAWRVWTEYGFVSVALDELGGVVGGLVAFQTNNPDLNFLHKLFVADELQTKGIGSALMAAYCQFLDKASLGSIMTTSPKNKRMIAVSDKFGFETTKEVGGYYRDSEHRLLRLRLV